MGAEANDMRPVIVLATDDEMRSDRALPVVAALALANQARVVAIHVHDQTREPQRRAAGDAMAARAAWWLGRYGIEARADTVTVADGEVGAAIARTAREQGAFMIALGSHGYTSLGGVFMGSVSHQVLALADCQVVIATGAPRRETLAPAEISKILVAVDLSPESAAALAAVEPLAAVLRARVMLMHVPNAHLGSGDMSYLEIEDAARWLLRRSAHKLRMAGVPADWMIPPGFDSVADRISRAADEWEADLLVLGSRRHRDLASALVGSVVHRLGHLTARPILIAERPARRVAAAETRANERRHLVALGEA